MSKLTHMYQNLLVVQARIESLVKMASKKTERETSTALNDSDFDETRCDLIAYSDAINVRFKFYYNFICKYLKLYLEEKYSISVSTPKQLFQQAHEQRLITKKESLDLVKLISYVKYITRPDAYGDLECENALIDYCSLLNAILLKINPKESEASHIPLSSKQTHTSIDT